jgi:large subunit ribosomal protein L38
MKNSDSTTGEDNLSYMQPFPMRNTGWHRCVYVLFEHQKPIDFKFSPNSNSSSLLNERSFKAADFFSTYKNDIKPVGLSFFQTEWDISVKEFFHNKLSN